jgi:hypothetical protein
MKLLLLLSLFTSCAIHNDNIYDLVIERTVVDDTLIFDLIVGKYKNDTIYLFKHPYFYEDLHIRAHIRAAN